MLLPSLKSAASDRPDRAPTDVLTELRRRMHKPQRHRLLHGYPLAAAMPARDRSLPGGEVRFDPSAGRGLLVGVLPHPFCNPAVAGCGFCTFPHQKYDAGQSAVVVEHVVREIGQRLRDQPSLGRRPVAGLYFGGGTANLTPAKPFRNLCRALASAFDLRGAEVTLEGVPAYFVKRRPLLIDILRKEVPARHFRISMGIQSFDEDWLRRMGRLAFGTAETFREAVDLAHARGFTASGDLLFNLPGQSLDAMRRDVRWAIEIGLDHVGLYHLVLFRGLGTAWSRDPEMLAALPPNETAAENWLALRGLLSEHGFYQATLTNFEREGLRGGPRRFVYEEHSFRPERYDMLGFGPSGISFAADRPFDTALKTLNPESAEEYVAAVESGRGAAGRYFRYGAPDLRVFYLTRRLTALAIGRREYRTLFRADPVADFPEEFAALAHEGLVEVTPAEVRPTPKGMFYADSVAALLAWRRVRSLRSDDSQGTVPLGIRISRDERADDNAFGHM